METKECKLNRRIALTGKKYPLQKGAIVGPTSVHPTAGEVVLVEWDNGLIQKVTLRSLLDEGEADEKEAELQEEQQKLEDEWEDTEKKIKAKLTAASVLIKDAATIASKAGKDLPHMEVASVLEYAMDDAGWSTSSWHC